jgi:hypothetical protein
MVVSRTSDIVDVAGTEALLAGGGAGEVELYLTQEVILELIHPSGREQYGRIPSGDQHIAGLSDAALGLKKRQVLFS